MKRMTETMTHDEATKDGATERYVLEEMTDGERDAFEEHYFDCAVCAEDVKAAIAIRDGLAYAVPEPVPAPIPIDSRRRWLPTSFAAAASAMIAVVSMHAGFVRPLRNSLHQSLQPIVLGQTRPVTVLQPNRGAQDHLVKRGGESYLLDFPIAEDERTTPYACTISDRRGKDLYQFDVTAKAAREKEFVEIELRRDSLQPGNYTLRIDTKPVVTNLPFTVGD
jgi:hypothetical protein